MALKLSLRDGEKLVVNGAILRSVGRSIIHAENQVTILKGRDIMEPDQVTTVGRQLYFSCMMAYIDDSNAATHQQNMLDALPELFKVLTTPEAHSVCIAFAEKVAAGDYYGALADSRQLIDLERVVLGRGEAWDNRR